MKLAIRMAARPPRTIAGRLMSTSVPTSTPKSDTAEPEFPHLYPPAGTFTPSSTRETIATGRPIPLNVRINEYAPLRHPKTHGHLVAALQLRAFEPQDLTFFADFAQRAAYYLRLPVSGAVPLPTRRERWTVVRSPFVHAKSKENFERRTHKREIRVYDGNPEVVEIWLATLRKHAMSGVGMKATVYANEELDVVSALDAQSLEKMTAEEIKEEHKHRVSTFDPTNVQFGNGVNAEVAQEVLNLLADPVFKPLLDESNKDTSPGAPELAIKESV